MPRGVLALLTLATLCTATWAVATNYIYDANGRLVVTTNDAGQSARYLYDKLGNITRIERLAAGDLAVFSFSPGRGAPGVVVKVRGHGSARRRLRTRSSSTAIRRSRDRPPLRE